jgi:hypothetical protein
MASYMSHGAVACTYQKCVNTQSFSAQEYDIAILATHV